MVDYREDAFQRIVNVGWGGIKYWVFEFYSNTNAGGNRNGLPTTINELQATTLLSPEELSAQCIYTGGSVNADADRQFFQYNDYQNINSILKRKALIDDVFLRTGGGGPNPPSSPNPPTHTENYFLGTLEGFFPVSGPLTLEGVQIGYVYLLGKYAQDNPNVDHFQIEIPFFAELKEIDRPLTVERLIAAGARDWSGPLAEFDGAPHNPYL